MKLIIDSGSTKSDWVFLSEKAVVANFSLPGINPYFQSEDAILDLLQKENSFGEFKDKVKQLFFYGAGCGNDEVKEQLKITLTKFFTSADILVESDLMAAALATFTGKKGISCILGTGSNSCLFDGQNLVQMSPSLGYILGDEASGSFFGKQLIKDYFYGNLPKGLHEDFNKSYTLTRDDFVAQLYRKPNPNTYLASFSPFLSKHAEHLYCKEMVFRGFMEFMQIHVCCFPDYKSLPVHFVGSISAVFEQELKRVASTLEIQISQVLQKPMEGLIKYHS